MNNVATKQRRTRQARVALENVAILLRVKHRRVYCWGRVSAIHDFWQNLVCGTRRHTVAYDRDIATPSFGPPAPNDK